MSASPRVAVLGRGVIGLTSAVRLLDAGYAVDLIAQDPPAQTTSAVAAAYWFPFAAQPRDRVLQWASATYEVCRTLARDPATGVRFVPLIKLFRAEDVDTWWMAAADEVTPLDPVAFRWSFDVGFRLSTPLMATPTYLPYLSRRVETLGGRRVERSVDDLSELANRYPVIVNCTGLGARTLAHDEALRPIRGHVLQVERPLGLDDAILSYDVGAEKTYIVPRTDDVILGGTAQIGDWSREPSPEEADAIRERCAALRPELREAPLIAHHVGLRPGRPTVRLETEALTDGCTVVHNYGHGGAGFTLAWGCADEVARRTADLLA